MSNDGTSTPGGDPYGRPDPAQPDQAQPGYGQPDYGQAAYGQPDYGRSPYGEQPGQSPYGAPPVPTEPPAPLRTAVLLMRVGALLSLLSLLSTFLFRDQIRDQVEQTLEDQGSAITADAVDTAVAIGTAFAVVVGLVGVALWLWMAWANGRGKSWARIVATVLFALSAISFLFSFSQPQPVLSTVLGLVNLVLGAAIVVLLWKRESSDYYAAVSGQRRR
ncbi:hypothetical protein [Nocardioides sp. Soil805]|uniref:hypothetical protein n=1 Tax=Nocardioides sp. Soil805 TaxID=1736416 RepID=UPI0007035FD1|nr:hypothetical protein [Nocardioides sp. Soil805]KRF37550.1 hypothetical protein ASG94_09655 [Nocardioides sp. Soil805]